MSSIPAYVLITPARNEAEFIEGTIRSVAAQTVPPRKWVIVSDGSTDGTDDIVKRCAAELPWIELVRMPERRERNFAGKVYAFNAGYERVRELKYEAIASLDADITFDEEYFAFLLGKLAENPRLGLVGTPFRDEANEAYDYRFVNIEHVSGACQLFRRECFEQIGGYVPVKAGSIDHIAVVTARMMGWQTRTFTERSSVHHRGMGTAEQSLLKARFKYGMRDYAVGNHPAWEIFRATYQMTRKPWLVGGVALLAGYLWAQLRRRERPVSQQLITFYRHEQMERLHRFFLRKRAVSAGQ
jgi:glycosyltransferase involved in cell wall biosynthesis